MTSFFRRLCFLAVLANGFKMNRVLIFPSGASLAKAEAFMYNLFIKNLAFKRMKTSASFVLIHEGRK